MQQRLFTLLHNTIRDKTFFFQIGFRKDVSKWLPCDFHTWHVNGNRRLSIIFGLTSTHCFVQLNGQWRVTIPTLTYRLAWRISIPVSLFSRDRKVRCKRAQAHVSLKDCEDYFGKERTTIDLWRHRAASHTIFYVHIWKIYPKTLRKLVLRRLLFLQYFWRTLYLIFRKKYYANMIYFCANLLRSLNK